MEESVRTVNRGRVIMPDTPGKCGFCHQDRIKIKEELWLCPYMYGSPMHFCDPVIQGDEWIQKNIFDPHGITIEEYLEIRDKWIEENSEHPNTVVSVKLKWKRNCNESGNDMLCPVCDCRELIYLPRPIECQGGVYYCTKCKRTIQKGCKHPKLDCDSCPTAGER